MPTIKPGAEYVGDDSAPNATGDATPNADDTEGVLADSGEKSEAAQKETCFLSSLEA